MKPLNLGLRILLVCAAFHAGLPAVFAQGFVQETISTDVPSAYSIAAADFDNDGDVDVAAAGSSSGVVIWIGIQNNIATSHVILYASGGARKITAADFDGDGDQDIVVAAFGESRFIFLENVGRGGSNQFTPHTLRDSCNGAFSVLAGDADSDGDSDLVTTEYLGNVVRIFLQQNSGLVEAAAISVQRPTDAVFADYDNDGDRDVVGCSETAGLFWIEKTDSGTWVLRMLGLGTGQASIAAADLDADGDMDIVGTSFAEGLVIWWKRTPSGLVRQPLPGNFDLPRDVGINDFDYDGDLDIVATSQGGSMQWWINTNGSFAARSMSPANMPHYLDLVDFDRDGDMDVLVADYQSSALLLYRNSMGIPAIIRGTVQSSLTGQPISGATVVAIEAGTSTTTDSQGRYFLHTAQGIFTLEYRHPCWNTVRMDSVVAIPRDTTFADVDLVRGILNLEISSLNLVVHNQVPTETTLTIRNAGDGLLTVTASAEGDYPNDQWLSISPPEVSVASGDSFAFTITLNPDTSNSGNWDYYGQIELRARACPESLMHVAVIAYVLDTPEHHAEVPERTGLHPVFPNPFNAAAVIPFELARTADVTIVLQNVLGQQYRTLLASPMPAGLHYLPLPAGNLSSGIYIVTMSTPEGTFSEKVFLLK